MTKFDPNVPSSESRVQSEPIRNNFNALNDRTDQLTPSATSPASASIIIGNANKTYFENNIYVPFAGATISLSSTLTGVSSFNNPGTFKEIIIFLARDTLNQGQLSFIESIETPVRVHSTQTAATLINDVTLQRQPDVFGQSSAVPGLAAGDSPLDNTIIICSIIVTNNGQTGVRGAISPIFSSDIIDVRPFLQKTEDTTALEKHIAFPTLAQAHPGSLITNSLFQTSSTIVASSVTSDTISVANSAPFDPTTLLYNPFVRITSDVTTTEATVFKTAKVLSISGSTTLILDRIVSVTSGDRVIRGTITLDKMAFDVVGELGDLFQRNTTSGVVEFKPAVDFTVSDIIASTVSAAFTGNLTGNASGSAASFTGSLVGDVTGTQGATVVSNVGTKTASAVATSVNDTTAATNANTASTIVKRDASGNFSAGTITATLSGNATNVSGTVAIANGGTGATTNSVARTNLGIEAGSSTIGSDNTVIITLANANTYKIVTTYTTASPFLALSIITKTTSNFTVRGDVSATFDWIAIL